jgi:hypothetical protein
MRDFASVVLLQVHVVFGPAPDNTERAEAHGIADRVAAVVFLDVGWAVVSDDESELVKEGHVGVHTGLKQNVCK